MAAATAMRSARGGGGGARRPFAPVAVSPPLPSRAGNQMAQEEAVLGAGAGGKAAKKCCSGSPPVPVSSQKTPAAVAGRAPPRTASRRRAGSCAKRCSTLGLGAAAAAKAAYDAPRAPVRGADQRDDRVRAVHSSPLCKEPGQERRGSEASVSRKRRAMMSVAVEEVMAGLPEPGEGRVKYLVNTFEKLLSLAAAGGGPEERGGGARSTRRKNEATATSASAPATPPGAEEIDVSYPSIASSSEASFPAVAGVACILDASDRTRSRIPIHRCIASPLLCSLAVLDPLLLVRFSENAAGSPMHEANAGRGHTVYVHCMIAMLIFVEIKMNLW